MDPVNHPKHYNYGTPEVIDIIDSWGLAADFDGGNVLKYFLRAPYKGKEEEDYRKAMWYLQRIHDRRNDCKFKRWDSLSNSLVRTDLKKINLDWFQPMQSVGDVYKIHKGHSRHAFDNKNIEVFLSEITLKQVINGWKLSGKRQFFIECFHFKNFNLDACIYTLDKIIDEVTGY